MADKSYTILIVPERSSKVRRVKVPQRLIVQGLFGLAALVGLLAFLGVTYIHMLDEYTENPRLKDENFALKARVRVVQEELERIDATLQRINQFTARVRAITQLNDPERNLAIGPLSDDPNAPREVYYAQGERIDVEDELVDSNLAMRMVESDMESLEADAARQETQAHELHEFFLGNDNLIATTPSIRPTKSRLMTSGFGLRLDPYTDRQVMHKGIDFAAEAGSDVLAPADGRVVFADRVGTAHGNVMVLDHGYGIQTHYAHLQEFVAAVGKRVQRGDVIAKAGNTGRTTGAHLHYEVRFNGIPQDPERFIVE